MLVPHATLWSGLSTRGPVDKPCSTSNRGSGAAAAHSSPHVLQQPCHRALGHGQSAPRRRVAASTPARSFEAGAAAISLQDPRMPPNHQAGPQARGPASQQQPQQQSKPQRSTVRILTTYKEDDNEPQWRIPGGGSGGAAAGASSSQPRTLKINVDLTLWRARMARIKARATLDLAERRALYKEAEEGLRRCLQLDPTDARAYVVMGKTLLLQKRYDEARALYQEGCSNTGNTNPFLWSAWGWLEARVGNADRARKLYDAAIVVDETHACAWHKWGMLEKEQGNYTRARDLWMTGITRCRKKPQSQNAYLYCALGCMAAQLGRVGEARAWFEEGTRNAEGAASVALWQAWAVLEAKQGDATAVRYLFRKSLGANPRSRYVHLAWALWEAKQGNLRQCAALLERGCRLNPTDAALYQAWALLERDNGRFERARQLFELGLRADPEHLPMWQAYGVMEAGLGNADRARQLFQEGVWADPRSRDTVFLFHAWGALEAQQGNHQTARELFKAAIRVDPKSEITWATWITMESDLGLLERADELRIRRAEQQWEFVVPAGFTTRPLGAGLQLGAGSGGAQPLLSNIADTLSRFFRARGDGRGGPAAAATAAGSSSNSSSAAAPSAGAPAGAAAAAPTNGQPLAYASERAALPADYAAEASNLNASTSAEMMGLEDVAKQIEEGSLESMPEFSAMDDGVEESLEQPMANGAPRAPRRPGQAQRQQRQPRQQQQQQPRAAASAGSNGNGSSAAYGKAAQQAGGRNNSSAAELDPAANEGAFLGLDDDALAAPQQADRPVVRSSNGKRGGGAKVELEPRPRARRTIVQLDELVAQIRQETEAASTREG